MPPALRPLSGDFAIGDAIPEHIHGTPACRRRVTPALHAPRSADQQRLDDLVTEVRDQLLLPIRIDAVRAALASGDPAELQRWADEAARNIVMAHGEVLR